MSDEMNEEAENAVNEARAGGIGNIDLTKALADLENRILQNQQSMRDELSQRFQANTQLVEADDDDINPYLDPKKYAEKIKREAMAEMDKKQASENAIKNTMSKATNDYPELNDPSSDFYKEVDRIFKASGMGYTPEAIRISVYEAAANLGLKPKSKRSQSTEEFSMSGSSSNSSKSKQKKQDEVPEITKEWSRLLGRNTDSDDYKKSISEAMKNQKRK